MVQFLPGGNLREGGGNCWSSLPKRGKSLAGNSDLPQTGARRGTLSAAAGARRKSTEAEGTRPRKIKLLNTSRNSTIGGVQDNRDRLP